MPEPEIAFRPLRREDVPLVFEWRQRPHVRAWWSGVDSLADAQRKYLPRIDGHDPTAVYLILLRDRPVGMIQTYLVDDDCAFRALAPGTGVAGVDLFIGEADLMGRGLGSAVIRAFADEVVFANPGAVACVADPDVRNVASIRAFEKAGFVRVGTFHAAGEEASQLLVRLDRGTAS